MTDVLTRLNEWLAAQPSPDGRTFHPLHPEVLIRDAAREIERLRAALTKWIEWHERDGSVGGASSVYEETCAALKGADDAG